MTLFPGTALITGAASGIGRATALSFAREGCTKIVICDVNSEGLGETSSLIQEIYQHSTETQPVKPIIVSVDMLDADAVSAMVEKAVELFGRVDYCVNAAGIMGDNRRSTESDTKAFDMINGINYRGRSKIS